MMNEQVTIIPEREVPVEVTHESLKCKCGQAGRPYHSFNVWKSWDDSLTSEEVIHPNGGITVTHSLVRKLKTFTYVCYFCGEKAYDEPVPQE
jgi:hypothetical protein